MDNLIIRACVGVFDLEKRMLLVRKAGTGTFITPGGKIEPDEEPKRALLRELREELSYNALLAIYPNLNFHRVIVTTPVFEANTHLVNFAYICYAPITDVHLKIDNKEIVETRWLSYPFPDDISVGSIATVIASEVVPTLH